MSTYGQTKDSHTQADEHVSVNNKHAKRTLLAGYDGANLQDLKGDSNGNLFVSTAATSIGDGDKDITTAGTAETLVGTSTPAKKVWIIPKSSNSGALVYVGGSTIDSTRGKFLYQGETIQIEIDDLQKIYIDVDTNGDGVRYTYVA